MSGFTWLAIGDSITNGTGATNYNGYVLLTRNSLKSSGKNHFLSNQGIPSITSTQYLNRFKSIIRTINPDVVTIMLGMNDTAISTTQFNTNISSLIDLIKQNAVNKNPTIFLCTITFRNDSNDTIIQQFNTQLSSIATAKNVTLVNTRAAYSDSSYLATSDVVHPNDNGHQQIANILAPVMISQIN
jgi:lysophospholipase L1-like esterase